MSSTTRLYDTLACTTSDESRSLSIPELIEEKIGNYLRIEGRDPVVDVWHTGEGPPFDIIIATLGSYGFRGPPPEIEEAMTEIVIRNWLRSKGNLPSSLVSVSYPIHRHCQRGVPLGGPFRRRSRSLPPTPFVRRQSRQHPTATSMGPSTSSQLFLIPW